MHSNKRQANKFGNESIKRAITEEEASIYIGMSRTFLRQSRMTGARTNHAPPPPFLKIGKRSVRYLIEDLDNWLEQFKVENGGSHEHE